MSLRPAQEVRETPSQKLNTNKRVGDVAQVIEHLSSMCEALGSIISRAKNKKGRQGGEGVKG
jgi:hypothetical protein